ncbi:lysozyme [Roseibium sp. TrichSKD4]|uniref:glycoside hydrolase family 25 protein n=1 Tax=Roseibium sp. TrichSKD4 TaxID=744980 RepID=UPI0001E5745E|nr:GH25 family lysozyme [Roseibium sp. TrichSKD4]EFO29267.1 lysozyme [Roseibium sp. TrichSKD4]
MRFLFSIFRFILYVVLGGVLCLAGVTFFFMSWEPDRSTHPFRGIDVSHHQGEIDWPLVAADDVTFVYMKATEGQDFQDKSFSTNWREAGQAGLARGAYHFFSFCSPGEKQALNYLSVLPKSEKMLPPVLDLEFEGNCARKPSVDEVLREVTDFVQTVEAALGRQVVFYVPDDFHAAYIKGQGLNRQVWARSLWHSPDYVRDWLFWQFHQQGAIDGIDGNVDLNVLAGNRKLDQFLK